LIKLCNRRICSSLPQWGSGADNGNGNATIYKWCIKKIIVRIVKSHHKNKEPNVVFLITQSNVLTDFY